jgi:hypothetical protein
VSDEKICSRCGLTLGKHVVFSGLPTGEMAEVVADYKSPLFGYCPSLRDDERFRRLAE